MSKKKQQPADIILYTTVGAAKFLSVSPRTISNWRYKGIGPKFKRIGYRTIRYTESDLLKFMN